MCYCSFVPTYTTKTLRSGRTRIAATESGRIVFTIHVAPDRTISASIRDGDIRDDFASVNAAHVWALAEIGIVTIAPSTTSLISA